MIGLRFVLSFWTLSVLFDLVWFLWYVMDYFAAQGIQSVHKNESSASLLLYNCTSLHTLVLKYCSIYFHWPIWTIYILHDGNWTSFNSLCMSKSPLLVTRFWALLQRESGVVSPIVYCTKHLFSLLTLSLKKCSAYAVPKYYS